MAKWSFLPWRQSSASKYRPDTLNYGCISTSKSGEFSVGDANNKAVPVMPVGCVIPFAGAAAPTGWLLCQGQAISRNTYAQLFSVIGTTYGSGDGKTTFNLPDMRGRVAVGSDANLGQKVGAKSVSLNEAQNGRHSHMLPMDYGQHDGSNRGPNVWSDYGRFDTNRSYNSADSGEGAAHENRQPSLYLNYLIKT